MLCIRLVGRIQLHLLPTTVVLLHDSKITRKQTKTFALVVSIAQDIKTRVITLAHQDATIAIVVTTVTHEISSMPSVTDGQQTKPIVF